MGVEDDWHSLRISPVAGYALVVFETLDATTKKLE